MRKFLWSLFEIIETITVAAVTVALIRTFIAQPFLVSGSSMERTFSDGDYLLVDEVTYRFRKPQRGEVVVFRHPGERESYYIKRIIGLGGERVVIQNGAVSIFRDGEEIDLRETYTIENGRSDNTDVVLGSNDYFVLGDNRDFSFDSRNWGPVESDRIVGVVRLRLWPVTQAMAISAPAY